MLVGACCAALNNQSPVRSSQQPLSLGIQCSWYGFTSCDSLLRHAHLGLCFSSLTSSHLSSIFQRFLMVSGPPRALVVLGDYEFYLLSFITFPLFLTIWDGRERLQHVFSLQSWTGTISHSTISTIICIMSVVDRITAPSSKDDYILIPRKYENVMSQGKGELRLQLELRFLIH